MKLSRKHKKGTAAATPATTVPVPSEQSVWPTKPTKAYVAAVITLCGLVGIHVTTGTAQALVMLGQLLLVVYGVWRARNRPRAVKATRGGVDGFLS